ncbi:cell envelope integrity protein CreD [Desulfovibrio sp. SGI.169]|uniref:cell envelope integrity protein CreD n=1 Tax=Desulfovibrio sp. SGI.169 TaxID=3420561 RepID=UPI003CFDD706
MTEQRLPENAMTVSGGSAAALHPGVASGTAASLPPGSPLFRFAIVAAIALALLIPLLLVQNLVDERASLYRNVVRDISRTWGGQQQLTGPILLIPYTERQITRRRAPGKDATDGDNGSDETVAESHWTLGYFVLLPTRLDFNGDMSPQERQRGIYRSLVYTADLRFAGRFNLPSDDALKRAVPALESVNYAGAYVLVGLSYPNALRTVGPLVWNSSELNAEPGIQPFSKLKNGFRIPVRLSPEIREYTFSQHLAFNGSSGIRFTPVGGVTGISLNSPWPHPSFQGDMLPASREITDQGFRAAWEIPALARSYPNLGTLKNWPDNFASFTAGVELYETATHYHLIERSVKYGVLFIGLTFLAFIIFELGLRARLHPVQYGLTGLAMVVFYLTLLSLSEHFAFLPSYAAASACTILMIAAYVGAALRDVRGGLGVGALLTALYAMLYAILQMEDYALLMGTALVLVMLGALMVASRGLAFESQH